MYFHEHIHIIRKRIERKKIYKEYSHTAYDIIMSCMSIQYFRDINITSAEVKKSFYIIYNMLI